MYVRVCPLNNACLSYYSAYMQFCQVLFLKKYICVNLVLDKIENGVYNVHRNPRGAFTPILDLFLDSPLGYSQGYCRNIRPKNMAQSWLTRTLEIFW